MSIPAWIESTVYGALTADPEFGALLKLEDKHGKIAGYKIYPLFIPQGVKLPAVVYQRTFSNPEMTLLGYSSEQVVMQVAAFSMNYDEIKIMAGRIRAVMATAPFRGIFRGDSDQYNPEGGSYVNSAEYICEQTGGYCHGSKL